MANRQPNRQLFLGLLYGGPLIESEYEWPTTVYQRHNHNQEEKTLAQCNIPPMGVQPYVSAGLSYQMMA